MRVDHGLMVILSPVRIRCLIAQLVLRVSAGVIVILVLPDGFLIGQALLGVGHRLRSIALPRLYLAVWFDCNVQSH